MESLVPIPWAHVLFGEHALLRAAERLYDDPQFEPRHWDLDEQGRKKPNKWRAWSSFDEQGYINKLDVASFESLVSTSGLRIDRLDRRSFGGSPLRRGVGRALMNMPWIGEYFVSSSSNWSALEAPVHLGRYTQTSVSSTTTRTSRV
jgi:hypothetical protein